MEGFLLGHLFKNYFLIIQHSLITLQSNSMKIVKVSYNKTFATGPYLNDKVGIEIELDEWDSPDDCLDKAKSTVEQWHKEANPHVYQSISNGPNIQTVPYSPSSIPAPIIQVEKEGLEHKDILFL